MLTSMLGDMTAPYSSAEAFFYDALIAPSVFGLATALERQVLDALPSGARVLEVGSGGGQLAMRVAAQRHDLTIVGLDLSHDQTARASRRARGLAPRVSFVCGSALELPFADATFDAVVSVASIKHWPDQLKGLRECVRVLRPGGALAVAEADRGCRYEDAKAFVARWRILPPFRPVALAFFRTIVAGKALDLDEARDLLAALPLDERHVERIAGTPGLLMTARAAAAASG
jgi:ubiquinone/menaquinone biosynthesis C-methylase UbiE